MTDLLKISKLPKSTYFFEVTKKDYDIRNEGIITEITAIYTEHKGRYGVRRVHSELLNRGHHINHKKVQRIMKKFSLKGKLPKEKYHSYKGTVGKIADNIINRDFTASKPDEKWTTDVSQFNLPFGKCYFSPILDMYTNEIISYDLSLHPNYEQITNMLDRAFKTHPDIKGLIFHSDQGWQYQMRHYTKTLKEHGIIQSMSRKGNCIDNCIMETFFGRMKNEMFYGYEKDYKTFEEFSKVVAEYIDYYNNRRIQKKTKWMPPALFRSTSICNSVI